jgi:hypothetical protein
MCNSETCTHTTTDFQDKIDQLDAVKENLYGGSLRFATDLIYGKWGWNTRVARGQRSRFSDKQRAAVLRLIEQATEIKDRPEPETKQVGSMGGLMALFKIAAKHLKNPKIALQLDNGLPVLLKVAGKKSRHVGQIMVSDGGPWGRSRYYGRITEEGEWVLPQAEIAELKDVQTLLESMATDPARTAARYGKITGNCCFCRRPLTDDRSTDVGYGPICAKHYELPWG